MQMLQIVVRGMPVSLTRVVCGQVGFQFRVSKPSDVDVWQKLMGAVGDRLVACVRDGRDVTILARFERKFAVIAAFLAAKLHYRVLVKNELAA